MSAFAHRDLQSRCIDYQDFKSENALRVLVFVYFISSLFWGGRVRTFSNHPTPSSKGVIKLGTGDQGQSTWWARMW